MLPKRATVTNARKAARGGMRSDMIKKFNFDTKNATIQSDSPAIQYQRANTRHGPARIIKDCGAF
jgi:hypothetical protein